MRINKYRPHILVLPEDDANRQIANGFLLSTAVSIRNIQILEEAGGWIEVLERFKSDHIDEMERYPQRLMVLLIDFDDRDNRFERAKAGIPRHLANRVFILGASSEPEALKAALGSYERIGLALARDCDEETEVVWSHALLQHNTQELERLRQIVRPILFSSH